MLRVEGVTVRFGSTVALDDVSIDLAEGERLAVLGPSGCGKSTLLRTIAGLETGVGRVVLDGNVITSQVLRTLSRSTHLVHRLAATHTPRVLALRQGPGTSLQFALKIVEKLYSAEKAEELAKGLLCTTA